MRNLKRYLGFVAVFAMLFTSCSKDQNEINSNSETATLSFGAIVNDLVTNRAANKQAVSDFPECTDDTPAYVEIVLMQGNTAVVGSSGNAYRVDLVAGQVFTEEDEALELMAGNYTLEHFSVYNASGDLIWLAPRAGSVMGDYVNYALPLSIELNAGSKKYVDVSVVCFDDRDVNEYGYLFFELDTNIALTYCFFANYCDSDGMHYPARYSVSIWTGTSSDGTVLYEDEINTTGYYENTGDYYASPLCFALPDHNEMDTPYLYYEVTLLDWADNYGTVGNMVMSGTITKRMIVENFGDEDDTEYHHLRFGCGDDDDGNGNGNGGTPVDSDGDGIPDSVDQCPNTPGVEENNGCPAPAECDLENPTADCDNDGILNRCDTDNPNWGTFDCDGDGVLNAVDDCPAVAGPASNNGCPEEEGCNPPAICTIDTDVEEDCYLTEIDGADADGYVMVSSASEFNLNNIIGDPYGTVTTMLDGNVIVVTIDGNLPEDRVLAYEVEVRPADSDGSMSSTCWESLCATSIADVEGDQAPIELRFSDLEYTYSYYIRVRGVICEVPTGGVPD